MLRRIWKDAQTALLIKNMQINTIMKDYYALDWQKEKLSNNTKCWQGHGNGGTLTTGESMEGHIRLPVCSLPEDTERRCWPYVPS